MFSKLVAATAFFVSVSVQAAFGLDARQIFEALAPSTVQIRSLDSGGSGVVLNDSGLILTNYHVVAGQIDLKVTAKVRKGGKFLSTEVNNVAILKVHPTYDLALLQIKAPAGCTFIPARIIPKDTTLAPGIRCFAIGNPGGPNGSSLDLSITEGVVSSASRQMDGLSYVQFSAAINPGNSGGPVCDDQGRVFGIATWKMTQSEGLGFAIPTSRISITDFVEQREKKPDPALAQQAEAMGTRYSVMAAFSDERDRAILLLAAVECFRIAMQAAPDSPSAYNQLAEIYQRLGENEIATKYAEGALKLAPHDGWVCHVYGEAALKGHENDREVVERCLQVLWRGLINESEKWKAGWCADDIGQLFQKQGQLVPAAYMFRWAEVLFDGTNKDDRRDLRNKSWEALEKTLPEQQLAAIQSKEDGFTQAELAPLLAGKPLVGSAKSTAGIPSATKEQMDKIVRAAAQEFGPTQISVPQEGLSVPLPDTPERAILAYAGWKVVITFPDLLKLGVFNLATGKIDGFIDCDDRRVIMAAGGQLLTTYSPASQMLEVYDLATLKKLVSQKNPRRNPLAFVGMGLLNPARIFVLQRETHEGIVYLSPSFLKLPDLTPYELRPNLRSGNNPLWNSSASPDTICSGSMDEKGQVAAVRHIGESSGLDQYTTNAADSKLEFSHSFASPETPQISHGGKFILGRGDVIEFGTENNRYRTIAQTSSYRLVPVAGFPAFAEYADGDRFAGFRIFGLPGMNQVVSTAISDRELREQMAHVSAADQTEIMLASAYCDRIAYVIPAEKKVLLFPLGLKNGSPDSEIAQPGKAFARKLKLPDGSVVKLQSGPPGMKLDEMTNTINWDVPADIKTGQTVQVILLVKKPDAAEAYAIEKILIP